MSFYVISGIISFVINLIIALFVYLKNPHSQINKYFALFSLTISFWSVGSFLENVILDKQVALFVLRCNYLFAVWLPAFYIHYIYLCVGTVNLKRRLIKMAYFISLLLTFFLFTPWFIEGFRIIEPWGFRISSPGPLYYFFFGFFAFCTSEVLIGTYVSMKQHSGLQRVRLKYLLVSNVIAILAGLEYFSRVFNIFKSPPLDDYILVIYFLVLAYAIIKYRLMDIDLAWRYGLSYLLYALVNVTLFIPPIILLRHSLVGLILLAFFGSLLTPYIYKKLIQHLKPAVLGGKYSYWESLANFWDRPRDVYTSSQLFAALEEIPKVMGLKSYSFFMFNRDRNLFVPLAFAGLDGVFDQKQAQVLNTIYPDDPLPAYLAKEKRIIVNDELSAQNNQNSQSSIIEQMDKLKAHVCAPLFTAGRLTAILNLGPKRRQEIYHRQDIEHLKQVVLLAEKHLAHIAFFENSIFFSGGVAHDIRKPFKQGIIYGYLKNICAGLDNPKGKSCAQEALGNLGTCLKNLHAMSEDMVDTFKNLEIFLKSGFKPQRIDYTQKVSEEGSSFKALAESRGLDFELVLPKAPLLAYVEPISAQRILNELLSNALKYTDKGKIAIRISRGNPQEILTEITDSGCGIPQEDQEEIWELFKRGESGQRKEGCGIGLAMVRQLVEVNGGRIWVKSEKDQGSSFFFTLPAWQDKFTQEAGYD